MILNYNLIWENLPLYFNGALLTLKVLLISLALGLVLAIPLALMRVSRCLLYTSPSPRDGLLSRMPSSA